MARILLLEDEEIIRGVLAEYMLLSAHEVTEAKTGQEALDFLEKQPFDLAVLDIMVPGPDGMEVLKNIRETEKTRDMGVIMLTALDDIKTQVEAFNTFADDYIVKPVSPIILLKRIETILRRVAPKAPREGSGLCIDAESFQVSCDGVAVPLTVSEFLILKLLADHPMRVMTREQLILGAFNEDYVGNDRIIDAHIKNIRKKLPGSYIKTVIGIGYQFDGKQKEEGDGKKR